MNSSDIKALIDFDKVEEYRKSMGYHQIVTSELTVESECNASQSLSFHGCRYIFSKSFKSNKHKKNRVFIKKMESKRAPFLPLQVVNSGISIGGGSFQLE